MSLMDQTCLIWGRPSTVSSVFSTLELSVHSPRAGGTYIVDDIAKNDLSTLDERDKVKLTSWLEEQRRLGKLSPKITSVSILEAQQRKELRIAERVDGILRYLESKSRLLGTEVNFHLSHPEFDEKPTDAHLIYYDLLRHSESVGSDELTSLLDHLKERGYIKLGNSTVLSVLGLNTCVLTVEGYERLEEIEKPNQDSTKVFIAMWFDPSMNEVLNKGIKPAITEAGYEPVRIDLKEHTNKIDDEIIAEIRRARFVVADFTHGKIDDSDLPIAKRGARGGVYYEAGFARGLGIKVIFTCRNDQFDDLHFDTRQYNHISWNTPEKLKKALKHRISSLYGDGPLKI